MEMQGASRYKPLNNISATQRKTENSRGAEPAHSSAAPEPLFATEMILIGTARTARARGLPAAVLSAFVDAAVTCPACLHTKGKVSNYTQLL